MDPMMPSEGNRELEDLAVSLVEEAAGLASQLHPTVINSVSELVRSMNCYYSNLIEGHDTHPRDIEKALKKDFSIDPLQRDLQKEARAHIMVQQAIDYGKLSLVGTADDDRIRWIHMAFYRRLSESSRWVTDPDTGERHQVLPGKYRTRSVVVGRHVPIEHINIASFMLRFEKAYNPHRLSRVRQVIAAAASHHRLLWIHPFLDGNGRVARLFSHAFLKDVGVGSGLWSISRGLARHEAEYKRRLMAADGDRAGDLDGRGNLSEKGLTNFCLFFLTKCIDQVQFMESLLSLGDLLGRIERYSTQQIEAGLLPSGSRSLLREALLTGEFPRGKAPSITGYKERQARTVLQALTEKGLLVSDGPRKPVRLGFPEHILDSWLPLLYPNR
ncbi:MAG: Fic family protein [Magnetococcales bacterium]|nr:Fic family protein [Magnetococcales bacterium]